MVCLRADEYISNGGGLDKKDFIIIIIIIILKLLNNYKTLKSNKQRLTQEPCHIYHAKYKRIQENVVNKKVKV